MVGNILGRMALAGTIAIGLAGCAGGYSSGYGGMAYNSDYDRYYGNAQGYSSVPYGYAGSNFGWSQGYYYPGTGAVVYNRAGKQRNMSASQRRYWEQRASRPPHGHDDRGRSHDNRNGQGRH